MDDDGVLIKVAQRAVDGARRRAEQRRKGGRRDCVCCYCNDLKILFLPYWFLTLAYGCCFLTTGGLPHRVAKRLANHERGRKRPHHVQRAGQQHGGIDRVRKALCGGGARSPMATTTRSRTAWIPQIVEDRCVEAMHSPRTSPLAGERA